MRILIAISLCLAILFSVTACGSSGSASSSGGGAVATSTSSTHLAKTKFILHAGLAFGAFHRYIYKPFRQGAFSGGLFHHKLATIKAALAAAFAYHEVKLALTDARSSAILRKVLAPLLALQTGLHSLASDLHHGKVNPGAITSANSSASQASAASKQAGQPVTDQPTPTF
jgi:hypothetical protein